MLIGVILISVGCRLLFRLSSQSFPQQHATYFPELTIAYLDKNNYTLFQGIIYYVLAFFKRIRVIDLLVQCLFDACVSLLLYFQLMKMQKFIPPTRYQFFHILSVLIVCLATSNNLYVYYVPNIMSHFEFVVFALYINGLINQNVFSSTMLAFVLLCCNVSFSPILLPQLFVLALWVFERPVRADVSLVRFLLLIISFAVLIVFQCAFYAREDLCDILRHVLPNIERINRDISQRECILQPNFHVFLRAIVQIAKSAYYKLEEFRFPWILHSYYDSTHSFLFWQYYTYILLCAPLAVLLARNRDIYNPAVQQTLRPLVYVAVSFTSYYLAFYRAQQTVLMLIYYIFLILFFHSKINASCNFNKTRVSRRPLHKIHTKPAKAAKKYCVEAENAHISTPHLAAEEFDDVYSGLKAHKTIQAINKITLSQMNDKIIAQHDQELAFAAPTNKLQRKLEELKLRLQNYVDTISVQTVGICLQLSGLIASYQISLDLLNANATLAVKVGLELIWKALLLQADTLFGRLIYNKAISLISFVQLGMSLLFRHAMENVVTYVTQSLNFGLLLFVYECCILSLVSSQ